MPSSGAADKKLRAVRIARRRCAAGLQSAMRDLSFVQLPEQRQQELDHERKLLMDAYDLLTQPSPMTPAELKAEEEATVERRWLEDEMGFKK